MLHVTVVKLTHALHVVCVCMSYMSMHTCGSTLYKAVCWGSPADKHQQCLAVSVAC